MNVEGKIKLWKDTEIKNFNGKNVATMYGVKSKGRDDKYAYFLKMSVFGDEALNAAQFKKGDFVSIKGFLSGSNWVDKKTGQKRSELSVTCRNVTFAESRQVEQKSFDEMTEQDIPF